MSAGLIAGISVAGAGLIVCLIAIPFLLREKKLISNCSARTAGRVVKYRSGGDTRASWISPLVEFYVDGKAYRAYRHYKGVVKPVTSKPMIDPETGKLLPFYVDEKEWFHKQIYNTRTLQKEGIERKTVEEIWPIGSEMTVVYNPNKPKQAFVEKVVTISNIAGISLLSCGGGLIALGVLFGCLI